MQPKNTEARIDNRIIFEYLMQVFHKRIVMKQKNRSIGKQSNSWRKIFVTEVFKTNFLY